jgi:hypothetical protein
MITHTSLMVFLLVLTSLICLGQTFHLQVVSELTGGHLLFVQCTINDDDLGIQYLRARENVSWPIKISLKDTVLFSCDIRKNKGHARVTVLFAEIYSDINFWLLEKCNWETCSWIAKDDGIYLRNIPERSDDRTQHWEPKPYCIDHNNC